MLKQRQRNRINWTSNNDLQDVLEKLPGRDVNIVTGDDNTKTGGCNVCYEDVWVDLQKRYNE